MIRRTYESVKNVIRWFPIIYKDRDWDPEYLFKILKFKLGNMEKYFRKYGHGVDSDVDADEMHKCVLLLERIMKNEYYDNASKNYDKKWGESDYSFEDIMNGQLKKLNIVYPNVKTEQDEVKRKKEQKELWEKEDMMKEQDMDLLFKSIRRKILGWWD